MDSSLQTKLATLLLLTIVTMGSTENTKLCDFTSHNNNDLICTHIAPPSTSAPSYEIKPALLNLVMKEQFSGAGEDAALHLNNFVELCDMQKYKEVDGDIVKLKLFPFSLRGRAKEWLQSLPKNSIDSWDNFSCFALCDVGASTSVMPKRMYDMLEFKPFDPCSFGVLLVDSSVKNPLVRIDDVLINVNDNYVQVDFLVMDIECDPSCPIILGRLFLRTVGAIIDMKEGNIRFQLLFKKGMEHFP